MTYPYFKETVQNTLQRRLGSGVKVTLQEIIKNNDTRLDGLTFLSDKRNISPTIYLNYYYKQHTEGRNIDDICHEILSIYKESCPAHNIDVSFFTDYEKMKERIIFKLINYSRNQTLLEKIPHIRILDLAVVFSCLVQSTESGSATILIYNHHLAYWNITTDDLYGIAMKNTPNLLSYELRSMSDVLKDFISGTDTGVFSSGGTDCIPMYVLSNKSRLNGSGCILYQNLLRNFSEKIDRDLYILPSSVHEVLLIPADSPDSFEELSDMVKEVNATQLSNEEILSDHVYFYSRETGKISMQMF